MLAHDEHIIERWNSIVTKRDVVYHLGDVSMRRSGIQLVKRLKGIHRLILGNHDIHIKDLYEVFNGKIYGSYTLKSHNILLTHIPVEVNQLVYRHGHNVHGHVHDLKYQPKGMYTNVNIEHHDYKPVAIEDIYK
jgi:calcineurin-like phosphoesterase family protein